MGNVLGQFVIRGEVSDDDAYFSFAPVSDGEVTANIMIEDPRLQGYVVLDLDASNKLVGIEIIGVSGVVRGGKEILETLETPE